MFVRLSHASTTILIFFVEDSIWLIGLSSIQASVRWKQINIIQNVNKSELLYHICLNMFWTFCRQAKFLFHVIVLFLIAIVYIIMSSWLMKRKSAKFNSSVNLWIIHVHAVIRLRAFRYFHRNYSHVCLNMPSLSSITIYHKWLRIFRTLDISDRVEPWPFWPKSHPGHFGPSHFGPILSHFVPSC